MSTILSHVKWGGFSWVGKIWFLIPEIRKENIKVKIFILLHKLKDKTLEWKYCGNIFVLARPVLKYASWSHKQKNFYGEFSKSIHIVIFSKKEWLIYEKILQKSRTNSNREQYDTNVFVKYLYHSSLRFF